MYHEMEKVKINWDNVNSLLDVINVQAGNKVGYVTGIPRGGTILAILYSHRFNIPYIETPTNDLHNLLILDDISDTGETLEKYSKKYYNNLTGTLFYKEESIKKPHFYGLYIPEGYGWIVFPWENENAESIQDYLKSEN